MSQTKKTYTLGKIKQLIDLNGDTTNFDLSFNVTCKDDVTFNLLVVDQTTLDNTEVLAYKDVYKGMSGSIVTKENIYQNYYLVLKSDTPCTVEVEITKKILETFIPESPVTTREIQPETETPSETTINWKKIIILAIIIILGIVILWWLYSKNTTVPDIISGTISYCDKESLLNRLRQFSD